MVPTEQGGLKSINAPMPILYNRSDGAVPSDGVADPGISPADVVYGTVYGVFHARLKGGQRDVLLAIVDDQVWEFRGWRRAWYPLAGPATASPDFVTSFEIPTTSDFPPQWVATPTGIVIVPAKGRAMFYDGEKIGYLGYDKPPAPPIGLGPESSAGEWFPDDTQRVTGVNDAGYTMDGLVLDISGIAQHDSSYMHPMFRYGRIGTVDTPGNVTVLAESGSEGLKSQVMGYLQPGRWRACLQFLDCWGNLSPLSPPSNDIRVARQPALVPSGAEGVALPTTWVNVEMVRKQFAWTGLSKGPDGTIGRILYRTKDLENSGDPEWYEVPRDSLSTPGAFATLPDNTSNMYPDNIPDAWLSNRPVEVQAVPEFRLVAMAFGRLWMANAPGDEGGLWWSLVGKWGTIGRYNKMYPDATASEITGLHAAKNGLIVFTQTSTYLITPNDSGEGFRSASLSSTIGCVAPSSIVTMRNGVTVWLGRDGFYAYDGTNISFLFDSHREWAKRFNRARLHRAVACFDPWSGEYRCWVSYDGAAGNSLCFTYDATAWRTRDDVSANGCTVSDDHRRFTIVGGEYDGTSGVWVLDRAGGQVDGTLRTGWIRSDRSDVKSSARRILVLMRETGVSTADTDRMSIKARIDWRAEYVSSARANTYPEQAPEYAHNVTPGSWGTTALASTDAVWRVRRPFWVAVDMDIGPCSVFQLEFTCSRRFEIVGFSFFEQPRQDGGARSGR